MTLVGMSKIELATSKATVLIGLWAKVIL